MSINASTVTLQDVARRTGVSKDTVSRILNGGAEYSRPTYARRAEKIRRVAAEMGYRPNAAARAVLTGRFGAISLLLAPPPHAAWLPTGLVRGLTREAHRHNLQMTVSELPDDQLADASFLPKALRELSVDGLLVDFLAEVPPVFAELIERHRVPAIYLNDRREADCLYFDDERALHDATAELIALGHRRIAHMAINCERHYSTADRKAGYERAMREAGLMPRVVTVDRSKRTSAVNNQIAAAMLDEGVTAITAYGVRGPDAAIVEAARRGLQVPEDLSIVVVHDSTAVISGMAVDTLTLPQAPMAEAALEAITRKIARPDEALAPIAVAYESISRAGSVCLPRSL